MPIERLRGTVTGTWARLPRLLHPTLPAVVEAGTGKTELAKAFGRWWRDRGGVEQPGWVIFHSFEPGWASCGLEGMISEIGLAVYGFEAPSPRSRGDSRRAA